MSTMKISTWSRGVAALLFLATIATPLAVGGAEGEAKPAAPGDKISYYKQVRPIFQANCQGCHQPAKAGGGYVMTSFDRLARRRRLEGGGRRPRQARRELPGRHDHARGRQGRDAQGQAPLVRRPRST